MQFIFLALLLVLFVLVFRLLSLFFAVESKQSQKLYSNTKVRREKRINPAYMFARFIVVPEYKRQTMQKDLDNLDVQMTVEQYYSECIYKALPYIGLGAALLLIGLSNTLGAVALFYGLYTLVHENGKLKRALDYKRIRVEEEAPNMIRFFIVSLQNTNDIQQIFEHYLDSAGYLHRDIERCLLDMKSIRSDENNMIYALEHFADRVNTPVMSDFVTGLINSLSGKNQENYFLMLERDLKELSLNNMRRKNAKVESNVRGKFYYLVFDFLFIMAAIIGMFMVENLK